MAFWLGRIGGGIFLGLAAFAILMLWDPFENIIITTAISLLVTVVFIAVGGSVVEWLKELDFWL